MPCWAVMLQRKLLDQIKITNNKVYENLPRGRLRRGPLATPANDTFDASGSAVPRPSLNTRRMRRANMKKVYAQKPRLSRRTSARHDLKLQSLAAVAKSPDPSTSQSRSASRRIKRSGSLYPKSEPAMARQAGSFMVAFKYNSRRQKVAKSLEQSGSGKKAKPKAGIAPERDMDPLRGSPGHKESSRIEPISSSRQGSERGKRSMDSGADPLHMPANDLERQHAPGNPEKDVPLPYNGVLGFPDCIINNTDPTALDRQVFDKFKVKGEAVRAQLQSDMLALLDGSSNALGANTPVPQSASNYYKRSQIEKIQFRDFLINTWYSSPFPEEYSTNKVIYMCEYCLKYMSLPTAYTRHGLKNCSLSDSHPPGIEIYRDEAAGIAFWEVDGRKNIEYCQNLCLLAKLFLNSKTLYYDVEPFVFYILTEIDQHDPSLYHFVGYFSKEKLNNSDYNVSCIITLPIYQRKGYGSLMIDFSYLLSRKEFKFGTPEKPLSDLGLVSYRNYWKLTMALALRTIYREFLNNGNSAISLSIETLSKLTGMRSADVVFGLEQINGLVKKGAEYGIVIDLPLIESVIEKWESKGYVTLKPDLCLWKPMIFGPSGGINSAPVAPTVAPATGNDPTTANGNPSLPSLVTAVSNSISMITDFLKDDIDNPLTYEEEAGKEIEHYTKKIPTNVLGKPDPSIRFCHPDFEMPSRSYPGHQDEEDPKIMLSEDDEEEDEEAENSEMDPEFEVYTGFRKRRKLQVSDSDDDEDEESEAIEQDNLLEELVTDESLDSEE